MRNVVVVGSQWGDEGKGKIVDWLSEKADMVVRFQGGHNAGHTLVVQGITYKLSLLPSGIVRKGKLSLLGNGVVIDPFALVREMDELRAQNISIDPSNFRIASNAALILPLHQELDILREEAASHKQKVGTTKRGIGPAYEDKVGRRALRVQDLANEDAWEEKLAPLLQHHNALRRGFGVGDVNQKELLGKLREVAPKIIPYMDLVWRRLQEGVRLHKKILFEGAQGALLDVDHGTYPYVTSSNTIAAQAAIGTGLGKTILGHVLGITKSYTTRVGLGPFPTEQSNEKGHIGHILGARGNEFGTVTGRKRRCGWFDAILVRQAVATGGIDSIALTKLDVLDGLEEVKICVGYLLAGKRIDYLPASADAQASVKPIYETMKGWTQTTKGVCQLNQLPENALAYIKRVEETTNAKIALISTSPARDDTILRFDPFAS